MSEAPDTLPPSDIAASTDATPAGSYAYSIVLMLGSEVSWVAMNAIIKHLSSSLPTAQLLFFRNVVTVPSMLVLVLMAGGIAALKTDKPGLHVLHAVIGILGMATFIFSLSHLTLSQTVAITYAAPLMITALSVPLLKEIVGFRRWAAVIVGFIGVVVLAKPDGEMNPMVILVLGSTLCFSITVTTRRYLSRTDSSALIIFYFTLAASLVGGLMLPFVWVAPTSMQWLLLFATGVFGMLAQFLMMLAIKNAPVSVVAPLFYFSLVFAVGIDVFYWRTFPELTTLIGAGIMILTGLYIIYRESGLVR